ncbi:hypothetical protein F5B20DRAFT_570288 [Whalleya microplaca]|nr:hypothetical protein F5B20DRAFT_570288 [Whalleya microplaca]
MWNSIWLRAYVFISFAIVFSMMLLATALLYNFSDIYQGISAQDASRQYGWRYGPTALLVVILSIWNQIDFATRTLAAWKELKAGPAGAEKTVLMDYVSPLVITVLWKSIKARHWAVMMSIFGTFFIQLATIFSAGLFTLEPTAMEQGGVPLTVIKAFDGTDFMLNRSSSNIGTFPTIMYYGTKIQGLVPPTGLDLNLGLIVPDFELQAGKDAPENTNYTANVTGAQVQFDCDYIHGLNGTETSLPWWSILGQFWTINITTPTCSLTKIIVAEGPDHNIYHQENATQAYEGYFGDFICDSNVDYSAQELPNPSNTSVEHRIVMTLADLRFSPYDPERNTPETIYLNNLTVAICKPSYTLGNYSITYHNSIDGLSKSMTPILMSNTSSEIPGFPSLNLGAAVQYSLDKTYFGPGGQDWVLSKQVPAFYQVLSAMNGNGSIGAFMDPQRLIDSGTEAFKGIATELILKYMMKPANSAIEGSIWYQEDRLWVRSLPMGFMCACFGILAGLSVALLFIRPWNVAPRDPNSIGAVAVVLTASPKLHSMLCGLGTLRSHLIRQGISRFNFVSQLISNPQVAFTIEPLKDESQSDQENTDSKKAQMNKWWVPIPVRWWFQLLTVLMPLSVIASLEAIQHTSDKNQGFIDVDSNGFANTHEFATYIPTLVAFCIGSIFASIQSAVCILAPWMAFQRGSAPASRSLFLNLTGRLFPHRLFLALQSRNIGVALIIVATFIAAWHPIIVSGLYVVISVSVDQQIGMQQSDFFDIELNNLFYSDSHAGTIAGLIMYNNLSYPNWTYGDLAFNTLETIDFDINHFAPGTQAPLSTHIGATRPSMNCTVIPQAAMRTYLNLNESIKSSPGKVSMGLSSLVPWVCDYKANNITTIPWEQEFELPDDGTPIYFGRATVLAWSEDAVSGDGAIDTNVNRPLAQSFSADEVENWVGGYGCPSIAVTLGRGTATNVTAKRAALKPSYDFIIDVTTIMCFQHLEVVNTSVTMTLPSIGTIAANNLPVPDESTAQYLQTQLKHSSGRTFEFPLNNLLLTLSSTATNETVPAPDARGSPDLNNLDGFLTVLATANSSLPIASLAGAENAQNLIDATSKLYKTYMVQALNSNMRSRDFDASPAVPGDVRMPARLRLAQQSGPKIALQAMLAVMVACAVAARLLLRGVGTVVPHNPCSFAGTATLLADGEVCGRKLVPPGAEWRSDAELRAMGVFEGWMFSLGWWESGGVYKYGVDIGWIVRGGE